MTLNLTTVEQDGEALADVVGEALASRSDTLADLEIPPFSTVVATDGRIMRLVCEADRGLTIYIAGRGNPLRLDRFQAAALALAFEHLLEGFGP